MGLDASNRDITNSSTTPNGTTSPYSVSFNFLAHDNSIRKKSSKQPKESGTKKGSPGSGSFEELVMAGEKSNGEHGEENAVGQEESENEPPNKPIDKTNAPGKNGDREIFRLDSIQDSTDGSEASSTLERAAPDGGWGWVVVAAAFVINLVADGVTFSIGSFYVEFSNFFKQSKSSTALIGSLLAAMPLLSGPIASSLTDRYGCRKVTVAGSLLAALGFVSSSFADSVEMLYITYGILTGMGLSLCYVAAIVIVAYYFEQRRSLATGISVCGGGIGTFIFAPLTQYLIEKFGWRNATRVLAIAFLGLTFCGLVMRDLEWTKKSRQIRKANNNLPSGDSSTPREIPGNKPRRLYSSAICIPTFVQDHERSKSYRTQSTGSQVQRKSAFQSYPMSNNSPNTLRSDSTLSSPRQNLEHGTPVSSLAATTAPLIANVAIHEDSEHSTPSKASYPAVPITSTPTTQANGLPTTPSQSGIHASPGAGVHRPSLTYRGAVVSLKRFRLQSASSCPDIISVATTEQGTQEWKALVADICEWCRALFEWRTLSSSRFILFVISNFLLYLWYDVVYLILQDAALQANYSETESSWLISFVGLFNMVGNLTLGYMGDKEWIDASLVYGICMIVCGFSVIVLPTIMLWGYVPLALDCGLYGLSIAANYSLTSVILVKVVSIERFATAYGLLLLIQGIGNLVGPPIAGVIYDWTGTSTWCFLVSGIGILLSSVFILLPKILNGCSNEDAVISDDEEKV